MLSKEEVLQAQRWGYEEKLKDEAREAEMLKSKEVVVSKVTIESTCNTSERLEITMDKDMISIRLLRLVGAEGAGDGTWAEKLESATQIDLGIHDIDILEDIIEDWKYKYHDRMKGPSKR